MTAPLVFDIKRYSINDGPGIRVTVFFKGCPLNCLWCHNPESIAAQAQKLFTINKCIGCKECGRVCSLGACSLTSDGVLTDEGRCRLCGDCARACPTLATEISGRLFAIEEIVELIEKERPFFDQSGGGVTFSGGEPLLFPDYLIRLLIACGEKHIHRAVDTSGAVKTETLFKVVPHTDLFLYDLKMIDAAKHKHYTGVDNQLILDNLKVLAESGAAIQVRIPLIGGINQDIDSLQALAAFVAGLPGQQPDVSLLPYHDVGRNKDEKLGQARDLNGLRAPTNEELSQAVQTFAAYGVTALVGG